MQNQAHQQANATTGDTSAVQRLKASVLYLLNSIPLLYLAMAWPGRFVFIGLVDREWYYAQMMYDSGIMAVWLLLLTFSVSPALLIINRLGQGAALGRWLLKRRRHFGLGSFVFSLLHVVHYVLHAENLEEVLSEALNWELLFGWVAFAVFLALAITSNRASTRKLGPTWKTLHRWVYPATGVMFLHWYMFDFSQSRVPFWLPVFIALKLAHFALARWRMRTLQS